MEVQMEASGVHHHHPHLQQQEMCSQTLESMLVCTKGQQEKKPRPSEQALKCPRCDSINTKFCYYNNYSLTQPRYFCKSCRRYWTKGGTLRNVPVGGGCRKNKRSSSSSSSATSSNSASSSALSKIREAHHQPFNMIASSSSNPLISGLAHLPYDTACTDLSLAFARLQSRANGHLGFDHFDHDNHSHTPTSNGDQLSFLDGIRGGFLGNHNMLYSGDNVGCVENGGILISSDQDEEIMNPMFNDDHHNQEHNFVNNGVVKQETCHGRPELGESRGSGGVLWGFPWQMGDQGANIVHEVDSGRSQIGGWNGLGSNAWHGLLNSPLM